MAEERLRPRAPLVARVVTWLAFLLMFVPLVTVIVCSFLVPVDGSEGRAYVLGWHWYRLLFANEALGAALVVSCKIAALVSVLASVIGGLGALALERGRFPGRDWLATLTLVPLVLPELVLGLASLIWFATLRLSLGVHSIVLAHVTFTISFVVVTVRARLRDFDPSLEEAAADLGAEPRRILSRITLPLALPGVAAGAMMAFTLSFDDFLISFFTGGVGSDTLPMKLYAMIRFGLNREMYALSSLLILATSLALVASYRVRLLGRRR